MRAPSSTHARKLVSISQSVQPGLRNKLVTSLGSSQGQLQRSVLNKYLAIFLHAACLLSLYYEIYNALALDVTTTMDVTSLDARPLPPQHLDPERTKCCGWNGLVSRLGYDTDTYSNILLW